MAKKSTLNWLFKEAVSAAIILDEQNRVSQMQKASEKQAFLDEQASITGIQYALEQYPKAASDLDHLELRLNEQFRDKDSECVIVDSHAIPTENLLRYRIKFSHKYLSRSQVVDKGTLKELEETAKAICSKWDTEWASFCSSQQQEAAMGNTKSVSHANFMTKQAEAELTRLESILAEALSSENDAKSELQADSSFPNSVPGPPKPTPQPRKPNILPEPAYPTLVREPQPTDPRYQFSVTLRDRLSRSSRGEKEQTAKEFFETEHRNWQIYKDIVDSRYSEKVKQWKENSKKENIKYATKLTEWENDNKATESEYIKTVENYLSGEDPTSILQYHKLVLASSQYPEYFPRCNELDFKPEAKLLLVDYQLPALDELPTLQSVRYVKTRNELIEKHLSQAAQRKQYDSVLFQIALRTIYELFAADVNTTLDIVVFNGYVESIDPATGREENSCILSISVTRDQLQNINLANVDPKACFKKLKGVSASRLYSLTPVAPLMKLEREDSRFISSYDVAETIAGENIAAMDWADFEHLIRELFEKEFATTGGEVKVTQASRDGGIDAVAFDPDPIRGGKIVIQAKRYTNTVGVSAVRDLYGTVINEGAGKGILVTTADYGPDAHEFAAGKPIVLLNGAQLLHLLDKHGHTARIDLKEAKQIFAEKE